MEKDLRDRKIIDLYNSGNSIRTISTDLGIGKSTVSNVINKQLGIGEFAFKSERTIDIKILGNEERFTSFVGWNRLNVNEYVNEKTGEVIRVAYVKAKSQEDFGYFVKLGSVCKIEDIEVISEEVKEVTV
jgi:hypothetical protein